MTLVRGLAASAMCFAMLGPLASSASSAEPAPDGRAAVVTNTGKRYEIPESRGDARAVRPARPGRGALAAQPDGPPAPPQDVQPAPMPKVANDDTTPTPTEDSRLQPRAVFPPDSRVLTNTYTDPYASIAWITFTAPNGSRNQCTGFMISADTVATAGHCVFAHGATGEGWVADVTVEPGRQGNDHPYYECQGITLATHPNWAEDAYLAWDYGAVKLDCDLGNYTGWLGLKGSQEGDAINGTLAGYPGDKPLGTQWGASGPAYAFALGGRYEHYIDMTNGQSGGPIFNNDPECNGMCARAINTAQALDGSANYGVGISGINGAYDFFNDIAD